MDPSVRPPEDYDTLDYDKLEDGKLKYPFVALDDGNLTNSWKGVEATVTGWGMKTNNFAASAAARFPNIMQVATLEVQHGAARRPPRRGDALQRLKVVEGVNEQGARRTEQARRLHQRVRGLAVHRQRAQRVLVPRLRQSE